MKQESFKKLNIIKMIKKNDQMDLIDLTQMSDDEIRHKGVRFLKDLITVLEEHEPFYMTQFNFKYLHGVLIHARTRLKEEESEAV